MKIYVIECIADHEDYDFKYRNSYIVAAYSNIDQAEIHFESLRRFIDRFPESTENPYDPKKHLDFQNKDCAYSISEKEIYDYVSREI